MEEDGSTPAHRTACHFWREIEIAEALPPGSQLRSTPSLAKLQEFFRRPGDNTLTVAEKTPSR